jgi:adenylyltransferase/sulfurtransferase
MGVLQALEAIKLVAAGIDHGIEDAPTPSADGMQTDSTPATAPAAAPSMLLFSAYSTPQFRNVRLRSRRQNCASCSAVATVTPESLTSGSLDYVAFCGVTNPLDILSPSDRLSAAEFATLSQANPSGTILLDVRDPTQFELCSLPNSINIPWNGFEEKMKDNKDEFKGLGGRDVVVVCKLGNDSQLAVKLLKEINQGGLRIRDLNGGFAAWRREVDPSWPDY